VFRLLFYLICAMQILGNTPLSAQQKNVQGNGLVLRELATLPTEVPEASGLQLDSQKKLWTHNDGGIPALYCIGTDGKLIKTVQLNANNAGWEDLAKDKNGNFYVGGFGDNYNQKTELKIYKIPDPATITAEIVNPEVIHYHYADRVAGNGRNYDMDAMTIFRDSIFLFTKKPNKQGFIRVYRLPLVAGDYSAPLVDSISVGGTDMQHWITGAATSPDQKYVLLLSHDKIFILYGFKNARLSSGRQRVMSLGHFSHKAGVCFADSGKVFIVDELEFILGGKLYSLDLTPELQKLR